jgi:hypothetical protein
MGAKPEISKNKNVIAWLVMMTAIVLHVIDEAMTDFLSFYHHLVVDLRQRLGFFPMPRLSFWLWLTGLIFLIAAGFAFAAVVARGGRVARRLTIVLGILMMLNACCHMIGSAALGRILPGFWSSPFLLIAAAFVVMRGLRDPYWRHF